MCSSDLVKADVHAGFDNTILGNSKRKVVGGLQFQFDLPYKGYFNVAPMVSWQFSAHSAFAQCGSGFSGAIPFPAPGANCLIDGNRTFLPTWAFETNYYMDLGFLPESIRFFSISGRATLTGPMGPVNSPLPVNPRAGVSFLGTEFNTEPARLTLDASKAIWGPKYEHFVDVWVAYSYWQNKYGGIPGVTNVCSVSLGVSNNACTQSTLYTGITVKF